MVPWTGPFPRLVFPVLKHQVACVKACSWSSLHFIESPLFMFYLPVVSHSCQDFLTLFLLQECPLSSQNGEPCFVVFDSLPVFSHVNNHGWPIIVNGVKEQGDQLWDWQFALIINIPRYNFNFKNVSAMDKILHLMLQKIQTWCSCNSDPSWRTKIIDTDILSLNCCVWKCNMYVIC